MNGPDHYREADRLLTPRPNRTGVPPPDVAKATAHAILALAAATAHGHIADMTDWRLGAAWREVIQ